MLPVQDEFGETGKVKLMKRVIAMIVPGILAVAMGTSGALAHSQDLPFHSSGSGSEVSGGPSGCQFGGVCTVVTDGTATSSHLGSGPYVSTLLVDYQHVTFNGSEYCVPVTGSSVLTAANGDTLDVQTTSGTVCGGVSTGATHSFTGTYQITGGTVRFASATGSGTETGTDDGAGNSTYTLDGTIDY